MNANDKNDPGQQVLDATLKALYAAAGVTDVVAERVREYTEAKTEEARERKAKREEQFSQAKDMVLDAPSLARQLPEALQKQVDTLIREFGLNFEEMAARGQERINDLRAQATGVRKAKPEDGDAAAHEAYADVVDPASDAETTNSDLMEDELEEAHVTEATIVDEPAAEKPAAEKPAADKPAGDAGKA
ncbi:hypothetical protein [Granulicoccus phenolivorans]|uniref:hypothetical protein n=1 Tax=Granulicoccus phenolivorans TaxID=266854 RepID=UPI000409E0F3|nr:hypothetical protein [Granulicoccus phenolivorans]